VKYILHLKPLAIHSHLDVLNGEFACTFSLLVILAVQLFLKLGIDDCFVLLETAMGHSHTIHRDSIAPRSVEPSAFEILDVEAISGFERGWRSSRPLRANVVEAVPEQHYTERSEEIWGLGTELLLNMKEARFESSVASILNSRQVSHQDHVPLFSR